MSMKIRIHDRKIGFNADGSFAFNVKEITDEEFDEANEYGEDVFEVEEDANGKLICVETDPDKVDRWNEEFSAAREYFFALN